MDQVRHITTDYNAGAGFCEHISTFHNETPSKKGDVVTFTNQETDKITSYLVVSIEIEYSYDNEAHKDPCCWIVKNILTQSHCEENGIEWPL